MKLSDILKASGNKYASLASDGLEGSDTDTYIQTGSFAFNALLSGSLYGGIPDNKIIALAGEQATGKTYFAMNSTITKSITEPGTYVNNRQTTLIK
jgi:RecA/RadA recombinase